MTARRVPSWGRAVTSKKGENTMDLYKHTTDGGAEYYSVKYIECPNGHKEGLLPGAIMRVDGGEIEIYTKKLEQLGIKLVIN